MKKGLLKSGKFAIVGALAFALTACGSGGNKDAGKGASSSPASSQSAAAEGYKPKKPIQIIAPSGAGGGWDKTARSIAKVLGETKLVNQPITVENKPGGGGAVFLASYVAEDAGNDYKLFVSSPPILVNNLKKEGNSPFGYKDVTPLAGLTEDFGAIAVAADSKYKDLKSLLDDLKADPKSVTIAGGSAPGSMDHIIAVLPAYKYGVDPKTVKYLSYDGGGEALTALLGGNAQAIGTDVSSLGEYLKAGKIRILAVSAPERLGGDFKDIPTMKEQGVDAEFLIWRGIFGPKNMSAEAKGYWEAKMKELSESDVWKQELAANAWAGSFKNAADFTAYLGEQEKLVKDTLTALGMAK
ncbi:Bug family tripartite tricarboxylate transporter substrate binding protein [Cohnella candidum]|uniref:Tripartite tricarboxylate transporter substrate binding protein n=1 Tax=Cohnella candidum TaxID=2674991 RepID=A0A3G3K4Q1_9BACL|nr:tripartite tricarboxylate transporter substrate binding protein [Cohnella candidum]AYQ75496.1 tripartite tricarboxylate transporter substrate binding protein [Cohnella candidum]